MAFAVKEVGKSGQICLGKARAGERFKVQEQPNGDLLLQRVLMIPADQAWVYTKETQAVIAKAKQWLAKNPPRRLTPEQLEAESRVEFPQ